MQRRGEDWLLLSTAVRELPVVDGGLSGGSVGLDRKNKQHNQILKF